MRETWTSHEAWAYECQSCGNRWQEQFDVVHDGRAATVYTSDGRPCVPPWTGHDCPDCHSGNLYSAPYQRSPAVPRSRHDGDPRLMSRLRRLHAW
ncbi:hypothetical protein [Actinomadura rayongensis]|uniref:Uncharacterized protein n=1 Tax=Actinomadura rayongensis TaxID=1429076 RepID=A0A6I4WBU4_9ACTN|nr:hypothetical protein [Actinomadura rayongensis]MXQ64514.1 hypothetical protein [Actinomadura rayongensis]